MFAHSPLWHIAGSTLLPSRVHVLSSQASPPSVCYPRVYICCHRRPHPLGQGGKVRQVGALSSQARAQNGVVVPDAADHAVPHPNTGDKRPVCMHALACPPHPALGVYRSGCALWLPGLIPECIGPVTELALSRICMRAPGQPYRVTSDTLPMRHVTIAKGHAFVAMTMRNPCDMYVD